METFKGLKVTNEYKGDQVKQWQNNGTREIDNIFGPYLDTRTEIDILIKQEKYLENLNIPFITTVLNGNYMIWKEKKAPHV